MKTDLTSNMNKILFKLNDLKSVFTFGEQVVPFIQSLINFLKDTVPLLDTINKSITDSSSQMPKVQNQISNVTNATELATTEILDLVDEITNNIYMLENEMNIFTQNKTIENETVKKLYELSQDNPESKNLYDKYLELTDHKSMLEKSVQVFEKVKEDTYKITLSLQVQDITAQQLAAVNHLIDSVKEKLSLLVHEIGGTNIKAETDSLEIDVPVGATFDPNASYTKDDEKQKLADKIVQDNKKASQDEIDKLFS